MLAFSIHVGIYFIIYATLAVSCNLIIGYGGMQQIGHGGFFAVGAYVAAILSTRTHVPFLAELLFAGALAALLGGILCLSVVSVSTDYFALATFAFGSVTFTISTMWYPVTNGLLGISSIPPVHLFGLEIARGLPFLLLATVVLGITLLVGVRLVHSPFGRVLKGTRDDEAGVVATGRSAAWIKTVTYSVSVFFAGVAGAIFAHYSTFVDPTGFTTDVSFFVMALVIVGGLGTIWGPVVGSAVLVILPELFRFIGLPSTLAGLLRQALYGGMLILVLLLRPKGLVGGTRIGAKRAKAGGGGLKPRSES